MNCGFQVNLKVHFHYKYRFRVSMKNFVDSDQLASLVAK